MRKILIALCFAASALWAADEQIHSISAGYGIFNFYAMNSAAVGGIAKSLGSEDDHEKAGKLSASSFNIAYGYDLFSLLEVGGILTYSYIAEGHDMHTVSVMPKAKFNWINRSFFRFYSQLAFGAMFVMGTDQKKSSSTHVNSGVWPMFQLSLLGFEFGDDTSFYCELGVGQAGLLGAGVKFRL
ncbi:hypothetical protein [Fibrobacter sp.]|uniref:hypothetical protein n=1 Tax=Fibrobacter sp. TaxID=35828 RepID=UPI00388FA307